MIQTLDHFDLPAIAASGQCFRITQSKDGILTVVSGEHILKVKPLETKDTGTGTYDFDCGPAEFRKIWVPYFDLDTDYSAFISAIDPGDVYLSAAAKYGAGLRILRQDLWEVLVSFLISQRKNIPAIMKSVEKLCQTYGTEIKDGICTFPSPDDLMEASTDDIKLCGLGYRAKYLHMICRLIDEGDWELEDITFPGLTDEQITDRLMVLPGIGTKVANCICLFGLHHLSAFPRDTWIKKIEDDRYGGRFPEERYPGCAGVMQQYLFFYERKRKKRSAS